MLLLYFCYLRLSFNFEEKLFHLVLSCGVFDKLVLSVIFDRAVATLVRFDASVASFVIPTISDSSKLLGTVFAVVRFFSSMDPCVDREICLFCEDFSASGHSAFNEVI